MEERIAVLEDRLSEMSKNQKELNDYFKQFVTYIQSEDEEVVPQTENQSVQMQEDISEAECSADAGSKESEVNATSSKAIEDNLAENTKLPDKDAGTSVWSQRITKYSKEEDVAEAVNQDLAEYINKAFTNKVESKELEELQSKFKKPANTNFLTVPKVNVECWKLMTKAAQVADKSVQKTQEKVVNATTPLVHALEELGQESPCLENVKEAIISSFELMANLQMDFNLSRKEAIRPHLNKASHIANRDNPITTNLFGDDVESEMKKVEMATKLHHNMKASSKFKRFQNFKERARAFLGHQGGSSQSYASPSPRKTVQNQNTHQPQQRWNHHKYPKKKGTNTAAWKGAAKWKKTH